MRFMVIVKGSEKSEAGAMPSEAEMVAMGKLNEEMLAAGILLGGEGLLPSKKGARVRFDGAQRTVVDGPFAEAKELIDGFALIQASSKDEAIAVAASFMKLAGDGTGEILQVFDMGEGAPR